uniref:Solute carrier family 19 member 3 n=2 Tax=Scleropages formosus TaxID=113540 RepID=A0A8D0CJZ1_SCLFO
MEALCRFRAGWGYPTALLCTYGFFSSVKPLEPFLIPYLSGPDKNITAEQVNNQIFPVWTYSYLVVLIPVFLLTDYLRYKPVVIFQGVNLLVTSGLLLWAQGVAAMQIMEVFYSVVTACEVAYFSYIYSVVDLQHYQKVTAYCRSVQLLGYTVGSVLGQLMVSFSLMSYQGILVLNLVLISIALVTSCFLPMPQKSMFFHRKQGVDDAATSPPVQTSINETTGEPASNGVMEPQLDRSARTVDREGHERNPEILRNQDIAACNNTASRDTGQCFGVLLRLWREFLQCYSKQLLYWSLWWALATCGYNQTVNYVQVLWDHVGGSQNFAIYNGGVEAVSNLFSAAMAYAVGFTKVNWATWGELALGSFSGLGAASLFLMTFIGNIWVCYVAYVIFKCLYMLLITIAMFQIAADLSIERYALVFGGNNFVALVLQTVITAIVVDSRGLSLKIIPQFIVYGSYFTGITILFLLRGLYTVVSTRSRTNVSQTQREDALSTWTAVDIDAGRKLNALARGTAAQSQEVTAQPK